MTVTISN